VDELNVTETPENVELRQRLCGIGTRFIAGFVDNMIILGILLLVFIIMIAAGSFGLSDLLTPRRWANAWMAAALTILAFVVYWGYFVFFELRTNGQSPGKKRTRIRVVKEGGGAITFADVAIRNLLRAVDAVPFYGIAGVCMFATKKTQRLGDLAAGTVVISEDAPDYSALTDRPSRIRWDQEADADALRATGLSPREHRLLYNYWLRREQLTYEARQRVLPGLLRPILERNGWTLDATDVIALEECVAKLLFPLPLDASAEATEPPETEGPP
jgi:uncharacterized RDD family membrane protein YckC